MRVQPFFGLSRTVQDRFIGATRGHGSPRPLLVKRAWPKIPYRWLACSLSSLALFFVLLVWDYGRLDGALALMPRWVLAIYGALFAVGGFCGYRAAALWWEERRVPFPRGRYLFPIGLIDATTDALVVRPLTELASVEVDGAGSALLRFEDGFEVTFEVPDTSSAAACRDALAQAKARLTEQLSQREQPDLRAFDPLEEPRYSNPLAPLTPWRRALSPWGRFGPYAAAALGLSLGVLLGLARNKLSERSLYVAAREQDDTQAYRAYLARGGKRADVLAWLLPNAELEELVERGSLADLERFSARHPHSPIRPAIDEALRAALLEALRGARAAGSMSALAEFEASHAASSLVREEIDQARQALMSRLHQRFIAEHASDHDGLVAFSWRLLSHLAHEGPEVTVRFVRILPDSVAKADEAARRDRYFAEVMLPSRYFDAAHSAQRERAIFEQLAARFERAFPPDALKVVLGEPVTGADIPSSAERPTLFVSHSVNMGGGIRNRNPNGTFFGVGFLFRARFSIPDEAEVLSVKYSTWKPPDLLRLRKGRITIPQVYTRMANEAFGAFEGRIVRWLFAE